MLVFGLVAAVLLAAVSPPARRFFKSLMNWGSAQVNKGSEVVAGLDPMGVYQLQIDNAVENGRVVQKSFDSVAANLVSLQNQVEADLKDKTRLENRLRTVLKEGDPNVTAVTYAEELERVEKNLSVNQAQLEVVQSQYDENLALVEKFKQQISKARADAQQLGFQLQQSEAEKEMSQMSANLRGQLSTGDLSEARRRVMDQINTNRGASKAVHDLNRLNTAQDADDELERKNRVQDVLNRFKEPPPLGSPPRHA